MRDPATVLKDVIVDLVGAGLRRHQAERLCTIEAGLYLAELVDRSAPVSDAWTLFSGYPFAEERGLLDDQKVAMRRAARYTLWNFGGPQAWRDALEQYELFPDDLTGYGWRSIESPVERRPVAVSSHRWAVYQFLFDQAPPFKRRGTDIAVDDTFHFFAGRDQMTVRIPLVQSAAFPRHDLTQWPSGAGKPIVVSRKALLKAAERMDDIVPRKWKQRLEKARFLMPGDGDTPVRSFTIDRIFHMLGIVGVGKSTLRDTLTYYLVTEKQMRVTIVVGDVAEVLSLVEMFTQLGCAAAPVLGATSREQHTQRLHRRIAGKGERNALAHDDPAFAYLSTSCALNALLGEDDRLVSYNDAPCDFLRRQRKRKPRNPDQQLPDYTQVRHSCPFWGECPRHRSARALVDADIWVATPAGLIDGAVPRSQNAERIRYLELAVRRSHLVIVDEADRVQMQLDHMFAPAVTLAGEASVSWLDELGTHKIQELAAGQRVQLSNRDVENWTSALNTASMVTDRIYALLVSNWELREWVAWSYFNAWQLGSRFVTFLFTDRDDVLERQTGKGKRKKEPRPEPDEETVQQVQAAKTRLHKVFDEFREDPHGQRADMCDEAKALVELANGLIHTKRSKWTRSRVQEVLSTLLGDSAQLCWPEDEHEWAQVADKLELTVFLCALEPALALLTGMWPLVQAALNLKFNDLHRRPLDYGPMVPEAPMGNILGFEFSTHGRDTGGVRSGELRLFRCSGVGRDLLNRIPDIPHPDGHPGSRVLLMSGSSWAGKSTRYHILEPVDLVLEPSPETMERITNDSVFRLEFARYAGVPLTLSGADPDDRPDILRKMVAFFAERDDEDYSRFKYELASLPMNRRHLLVLTGSYDEAKIVADAIAQAMQRDRVVRLVPDDEPDREDEDENAAPALRRGDVSRLSQLPATILVAPLLAVERGHNILDGNEEEAAIGTVYFLARPNPRPDDLGLAIHAINDWVTRSMADGSFRGRVRAAESLGAAGLELRHLARKEWYRVMGRSLAWSRLGDDRGSVTWDLLVLMWQVIGRLVRGGVEARVVLVDAAFAPGTAKALQQQRIPGQKVLITDHDDAQTSLLLSIHEVLGEYLNPGQTGEHSPRERAIVKSLYAPLWHAIDRCIRTPTNGESQ
ncbi:pPIWI_RE_Z domain-containing protein [Goodfellowiella coeruleoviolacea]|uniref:pPIWI-RE three-gene island domain-containing protein n=1 Tax=Goodfellowiella coeruleoviolacea TaxID=334858 RepID=A0AAE3GFF1_9PSEU|nr:hypothetical protein [Goodfellowiella coeruleoviolacea]MCP2167125.1 hypothetical protein [Goodfellowiella coeruleoviolacea]